MVQFFITNQLRMRLTVHAPSNDQQDLLFET